LPTRRGPDSFLKSAIAPQMTTVSAALSATAPAGAVNLAEDRCSIQATPTLAPLPRLADDIVARSVSNYRQCMGGHVMG
jgi:hypothetical protein